MIAEANQIISAIGQAKRNAAAVQAKQDLKDGKTGLPGSIVANPPIPA